MASPFNTGSPGPSAIVAIPLAAIMLPVLGPGRLENGSPRDNETAGRAYRIESTLPLDAVRLRRLRRDGGPGPRSGRTLRLANHRHRPGRRAAGLCYHACAPG